MAFTPKPQKTPAKSPDIFTAKSQIIQDPSDAHTSQIPFGQERGPAYSGNFPRTSRTGRKQSNF